MALPADYISGTITLTSGSASFTGTGTGWLAADFREGDVILDIVGGENRIAVIEEITGNAAGTLANPWEGATLTDVAYRMRYQWDSSRVSAQTRTMIEKLDNGNLESFSGVTGPGVVVMDGPHSVVVRPESDFVNGVAYDVQVDTLADRDAYDGQSAGFAVLVSDIGDGRSAVYSKASNTIGDWTDPAFVTGPVGPIPVVTVGTVTTGDPGTDVIVTPTPTVDGVELDFTIPSGRGPVITGNYNPATAYVMDDAVLYNGSTWIALQPTTGNAPPVLPTTSNAYWQLMARQGVDGAGTVTTVVGGYGITIDSTDPTAPEIIGAVITAGDGISVDNSDPDAPVISAPDLVEGPASAVADRIAVFNGTSGKLIKDGGKTIAELTGGTGALQLPAGTTAQRPGSPASGMIRYNTTESKYEVYRGSNWEIINTSGYPYTINVALVAGGGSGPQDNTGNGGGGGGGGVVVQTVSAIPGVAHTIVIGAGGATAVEGAAANGSNSTMTGVTTAVGGGRGGYYTVTGAAGGSGGGGGQWSGSSSGGAATSGQGNAGGSITSGNSGAGGGGGGAVGGNTSTAGGPGGDGTITAQGTFGGGGGGANHSAFASATTNIGGTGGGGAGKRTATAGVAGTANTGGGGGGGGEGIAGGSGGSGICVIWYAGAQVGTGGTVTSAGGNTIHTFTGSGTFTA